MSLTTTATATRTLSTNTSATRTPTSRASHHNLRAAASASASASASRTTPSATKTLPRTLRKRPSIAAAFGPLSASASSSSPRAGRKLAPSRSTPNLGALFASHARRPPIPAFPPLPGVPPVPAIPAVLPAPPPRLARKASLAALTQSSLATIPDATESYAFDTLNELDDNASSSSFSNMAPVTPGRFSSSVASYAGGGFGAGAGDDVAVGDAVDVPGGMSGTVRFVGTVAGRKGVFAGVELHPEYAPRGKNNGDVDGVSYFNTSLPGAGIFLPLNKAQRRDVASAFPPTPPMGNGPSLAMSGLKLGTQNSTNFTPPTPSLPKFSQSVSGGGPPRAPSPQQRRPPRMSLPRPDSPVRRLQMATPGGAGTGSNAGISASRPSLATPARFGSPTSNNKLSQSMRAPATGGDPSKKSLGGLGLYRGAGDRKPSIGPRSASALGGTSNYGDDDNSATPTASGPGRLGRATNGGGSINGSVASVSSSSYGQRGNGIGGMGRPSSRTATHKKNGSITVNGSGNGNGNGNGSGYQNGANDEELERLRTELADRERQLKDQANTLADMEGSLTELQTLIESSDGPLGSGGGGGGGGALGANGSLGNGAADDLDDQGRDLSQLRALLREKNDKIAMLTAEFDAHRADFRSTIDTLEMASTETERVYEDKIQAMIQETQELGARLSEFDSVARQLKEFEEIVQELEEGLEDARRGEAEARGEVEFLRGEVERTRTELRREREKTAAMLAASPAPGAAAPASLSASASTSASAPSKELEQKDDEIRGLKAIIHSLSQNAGVVGDMHGTTTNGSGPAGGASVHHHRRGESINERLAREKLEREVSELRSLLDTKSTHELEMERELEQLRLVSVSGGATAVNGTHRTSAMTAGSRSSLRDSRGTVVLARDYREIVVSSGAGSGGAGGGTSGVSMPGHKHHHSRSNSNSRLLASSAAAAADSAAAGPGAARKQPPHHVRGSTLDTMPESDAYSSVTESSTLWCEICETNGHDILTCTNMFGTGGAQTAPKTAPKTAAPPSTARPPASAASSDVKILPNPMESGPVAGKESGVVDAGKWCALCERDGHDSVDCPFEDAF